MRKQRTREHIIEDLGFTPIERQILYAGFTIHRYTHNDYGYDGHIHTFNELGEIESDGIYMQFNYSIKTIIMEGRRVYKEMVITYAELAQALIQLGFQNQSDAHYFRFVNSEYNARVLLKSNPENQTLFKAIISGYSYQLYMQGVIDDFDDLAKLVEKNREVMLKKQAA